MPHTMTDAAPSHPVFPIVAIREGHNAIRLTVEPRPDGDASPFGAIRLASLDGCPSLRSTVFGSWDSHGVPARAV